MRPWIIITLFFAGSLSGCMHITTQPQPVNPAVRPALEGRDCVPILFGIGFGTNTVERAMQQGGPVDSYLDVTVQQSTRITRLHSLAVEDSYVVLAGHRCLIVTGEP